MRTAIRNLIAACLLSFAFGGLIRAGNDAPPAEAKVSSFAPAADLISQLTAIAGRLDNLLAKPEEFDDARQSRIAKEADVAAVVSLALALSDEQYPLRPSAPSALAAARAIANATDYTAAKQALDRLKEALNAKP